MSEIRMVLVGKTGTGKSALGNSLLQDRVFESNSYATSVTSSCQLGTKRLRDGSKLVVVDTPGIFDTRNDVTETSKEVERCTVLSSPGPHIFVLVLKIGRYTQEEMKTIQHLKDLFGERVLRFVIVVFTGKDVLDYEGMTIHQYIKNSPEQLRSLIHQSNGRVASINNRAESGCLQADVSSIIQLAKQTIQENSGTHYPVQSRLRQEAADKLKVEQELNRIELERVRLLSESQLFPRHEYRGVYLRDYHRLTGRLNVRDLVPDFPNIFRAVKLTLCGSPPLPRKFNCRE